MRPVPRSPASPPPADNIRGALWMSAAAVLFATEALMARWMNARGIPLGLQLFARSAGQLLWLVPLFAGSGVAVFGTRRAPLHVLRGVCSLLTWACYFAAFRYLDVATATVLSFTNVMFTTLLAGPLLRERVDAARWAGTLLGFAGVAVMLRPGADLSLVGAGLSLLGALFWCGITLGSRALTRTERTDTIVAWVGLVTTLGALPLAVSAFQPLPLADWLILLGFALFTPGILVLMTEGFRAGEASAVAPFQYLRLVVVAGFGWIVWNEVPDGWTWLGTAIILCGALVVTIAEARRR